MALILKLISFVFSYSVQLKLALPQAAQLSINFLIIRKIVVLQLLKRPQREKST